MGMIDYMFDIPYFQNLNKQYFATGAALYSEKQEATIPEHIF